VGDYSVVYEGRFGRQTEELTDKSKLDLYMRAATSVNLDTLSNNNNLNVIELSKNQLELIDLEPLRTCPNLHHLRLRSNRLNTIDLWPLVELGSIEEIDLVDNRIQNVNITPLIGKARIRLDESVHARVDYVLRYLIGGKDSSSIELCKPAGEVLDSSPKFHWQYYADLTEEYGWESVHYNTLCIIENLDERSWFRAQKGLLEGMGLSEISGFDGNPTLLLKDLEETSDFQSVRSSVFDVATELLESQLQEDGSTIFLDVDKLADTRALRLIPMITKLREKEIENAIVQIGGNQINLLPLWLTHWGYEILRVLRFGLTTDLEGFDLIQRNFRNIGHEIRTEQADPQEIKLPENLSKGLVDYIYTVATMNYTDSWIRR
jgi:hypothetical protein